MIKLNWKPKMKINLGLLDLASLFNVHKDYEISVDNIMSQSNKNIIEILQWKTEL